MRRRSRSSLVVLTLVLVVALALPSVAMAAMEDPHEAGWLTSKTNPAVGEDGTELARYGTWRWQWGNSLEPNLNINPVPTDEDADHGEQWRTLGFIYEVRQVDPSGIGSATPVFGTSSRAPRDGEDFGSSMNGTFDIVATNHLWGWTPGNGGVVPGEGMYSIAWLYYNQFRVEDVDSVNKLHYGIDLTKPNPVEGLTASASGLPSKDGKWTEARRRDLRWTRKGYDALSGVGGFQATINGKQAAFAHNVAPDVAYEPYGRLINGYEPPLPQVSNITIEDIPAGESVLGIKVVDRATNMSSEKTVKSYVDFDTPKISITSPSSNGLVALKPTFKVSASDAAGITQVRYYIDNVYVGASTKSPFSLTKDMSSVSNGSHTLKAVAYDQIGTSAPNFGSWKVAHTATTTRTFKVDKTRPSLSSISGAPNPFFPRKRDGYKDNLKVKFRSSESGTAKLTIKNSKGTVVRTVTKKCSSGSNYIYWNGKYNSGSVKAGTFRYVLSYTDAAGNSTSSSSRKATIKFYELVKTARNKLKVVSR